MKPLKASKPYEKSWIKKIFGQAGGFLLVLFVFLLGSGLMFLAVKYKGINLGIEDMAGIMNKKQEILSRLRINLFKVVEAEKSAVIADTDEASQSFAAQSLKTVEFVDRDQRELDLLVKNNPTDQEIKLFQEFKGCWTEFRKTDQQLLDYAVKNTNIKAANLSFEQGTGAMRRFEEALNDLIGGKSLHREEGQIAKLAGEALVAGFKIHYLHAPHIAAANDDQMDKIEADIKKNQEKIQNALNQLKPLVPAKKQAAWQKAKAADDELIKVTSKVIELSRQNTNIKSFELSLGRKRKITAQCDEILLSLEEAVRNRSFKATR
ncbi:MAG: hypothetical protein C0407_03835 [Desulfobacca sp.]|nr:hypothetical protein [Desulfobacca sp.]